MYSPNEQAAYKTNLASLLDGVEPDDISLSVTAASVRVVTEIGISAATEAVANAAVAELSAYGTASLSQARCKYIVSTQLVHC